MRKRRRLAERTMAAIAAWTLLDGKQFGLLTLVVLSALALGLFVH